MAAEAEQVERTRRKTWSRARIRVLLPYKLIRGQLDPVLRLCSVSHVRCRGQWQTVPVDDEELLAQAEEALTEIKVNHGLSERHASVLAALRIRLKGSAGKSLEEMLAAAGDLKPGLEDELAKAESERKPSLDDLLSERKPKADWPS